jgi:hypothetical protein
MTVVAPSGKVEPEGGTQTMTTDVEAGSVTTGSGYVTVAAHCPAVASTMTLGGQLMVGDLPSFTVMVNAQVEVLPALSVAEQFTVFTPSGKTVPEGGRHITVAPGQLSVAEAST